ncbi:hypothetical protein SAMN05421753_12079 [Planctomicrobium piriforme]|uniref:Uncharacterized protein n=1 Tax=Planctomicrobium piriforme TaxID=1576369 RepID=A0A1I3REU6_9PLAN|nr:hypothetical protein SAMN05421753_12079 [Planctomicrobium piriforme]
MALLFTFAVATCIIFHTRQIRRCLAPAFVLAPLQNEMRWLGHKSRSSGDNFVTRCPLTIPCESVSRLHRKELQCQLTLLITASGLGPRSPLDWLSASGRVLLGSSSWRKF